MSTAQTDLVVSCCSCGKIHVPPLTQEQRDDFLHRKRRIMLNVGNNQGVDITDRVIKK